ncbi:hypothetical protein LLG95_14115 [bacterium]|nr:hypothetical protein [bacterium]
MANYPKVPIYLFYGNQTERITAARDQVLADRVPPEMRDENLTEYYPTSSGDTVKLADLFDEIAGDMEMMSFFPDVAKCAVVTNPVEIFSSTGGRPKGRAKKGAEEKADRMLAWIAQVLPTTSNFMIVLAFEDESAGREVNAKSGTPLFQAIQKVGYTQGFSDVRAAYRIEDAIAARDLDRLLGAIDDLWKAGKGDMAVYNNVVRALRFHMEANIGRERRLDADARTRLMPEDPQRNLFKAHDFIQKKYARAAYRTADLIKAYQKMVEVYRALRPRPGDLYVADARGLLVQAMAELMTSRAPAQR